MKPSEVRDLVRDLDPACTVTLEPGQVPDHDHNQIVQFRGGEFGGRVWVSLTKDQLKFVRGKLLYGS